MNRSLKRLLQPLRWLVRALRKLMVRAALVLDDSPLLRAYLAEQRIRDTATSNEFVISDDTARDRTMLVQALEAQRRVERLINVCVNRYYKGKHPKHHLWLEHNRFLYEAVTAADRVLDIGCGGSAYQDWIAHKVRRFVAVDIDPDRIAIAQRNHPDSLVEYRVMDVRRDLPAEQYDVAICSHVLEHLDEPVAFLRRLAAAVPRIVIKVPLADSDWIKLTRKDLGLFWMDDHDHRREYSEDMLRAQLEEAGWQIDTLVRGYDLRAIAHAVVGP